jgi:hypothetical protein
LEAPRFLPAAFRVVLRAYFLEAVLRAPLRAVFFVADFFDADFFDAVLRPAFFAADFFAGLRFVVAFAILCPLEIQIVGTLLDRQQAQLA